MNYSLVTIGKTFANENGFGIEIEPEYQKALEGLEGFSYIQVIWWFTEADNQDARNKLTEEKPYKNAPDVLGIFATRSPERPNPLAISTVCVAGIDLENGIIYLEWIDAFDGTPVLDIKPYTPSVDRVETPVVPTWCSHWPLSVETSSDFDWENEFQF